MKHAVLGAGGVGGLIAALLADAGESVTVVVRPGASHPERMTLDRPSGQLSAAVEVATSAPEDSDALWITVKATQLEAALVGARGYPALKAVVPLLNGVDHIARLRGILGERVVPATIAVEAERLAPGHAVQRSPFVRMGIAASGQDQLAASAEHLKQRGVELNFVADEATLLWSKLCFLAPIALATTAAAAEFALAKDGEDQSLTFQVVPSRLQEQPYTVTAVADYNGQQYRDGYHTAGYTGLRPYNLYRSAQYETRGVNAKVAPGLNVGYIMGTGDDVPDSLENLGVKVHFLSEQDVAGADLQKFDAIVLGVRTYAARTELRTYNNRLLDYVKNGGVVIVQYNTPQYDHNYGPYPYKLTGDPEKVVDETSKVDILDPNNPLLTWPNQISAKDFDGWVEERGHDFMSSWDPRWETPLETHDPDQDAQKGGLLYAHYGKGSYIYIAYALYRQLGEGVPGAYRLFANMLSLARHP